MNESKNKITNDKKFWTGSKSKGNLYKYGSINDVSAKILIDYMNKNEYKRLVSIGGGYGTELNNIISELKKKKIKKKLKKKCNNCKIVIINTDPYKGWELDDEFTLTAKKAIAKYRTENTMIKTLFFVSWPHPEFPYINYVIDANVPFVYIGDRYYKKGLNTHNIQIPKNIIINYENIELNGIGSFYIKEKFLTPKLINDYLNGYKVEPEIELKSAEVLGTLKSIGWILVPHNDDESIFSFVGDKENEDKKDDYIKELNKLVDERGDKITSLEINYILKYGYIDNIMYLIKTNKLKQNLYSIDAFSENKKITEDKKYINYMLLWLYLWEHKNLEEKYDEFYLEDKNMYEYLKTCVSKLDRTTCDNYNNNIKKLYNHYKIKDNIPQLICSEQQEEQKGGNISFYILYKKYKNKYIMEKYRHKVIYNNLIK